MPVRQIESPEAKYLAATDILIGDMSDINYEFLLFDRPIILLANDWLRTNFPDIGIKTDINELEEAIERSINNPLEYAEQRKEWLEKTIHKPFDNASERVLKVAISKCGYHKPNTVIIHGSSEVRKSNLKPLYEEALSQDMRAYFVSHAKRTRNRKEQIYFAAHFEDLKIHNGYKVHLDHGLKGQGTANVEMSKRDYLQKDFFPIINLHITAGQIGDERTKMLLGPNSDRTAIGGYPKADHLNKLNTWENKKSVFKDLEFDDDKLLITYAPAGKQSYEKPGGSLGPEVIRKLDELSMEYGYNILVKLKYSKPNVFYRVLNKFRRCVRI